MILDNSLDMGGLEKKLFDFISRIDKNRYRIVICCLKYGGYFKESLTSLGLPFYENLLAHKYDLTAFWKLKRIIKAEQVELIYSFGHANTLILTELAKRFGLVRGLIISIHATGSPSGGRLIGPFQQPFMSRVDRFLAVAYSHKRYLVDKEGLREEKIEVIHNGVDIDRYHPGPPDPDLKRELGIQEGERVVVTVASLRPVKTIDNLLRAVPAVLENQPNTRFLLVGGGSERTNLTDLAGQLGVSKQVTFAGIRNDIEAILRLGDYFVLPSKTEAFPNVLLEAMASGLPIVTTDVGSVRELVTDGESAYIVPPQQPEALSRAINKLMSDDSAASAFKELGRRIVEDKFTLKQMCDKRQQIFDEVLAQHGQ
jgi:glycosyltransferase involved in cell wall biosynthesis